MEILPDEMVTQIMKSADKKSMRALAQTHRLYRTIGIEEADYDTSTMDSVYEYIRTAGTGKKMLNRLRKKNVTASQFYEMLVRAIGPTHFRRIIYIPRHMSNDFIDFCKRYNIIDKYSKVDFKVFANIMIQIYPQYALSDIQRAFSLPYIDYRFEEKLKSLRTIKDYMSFADKYGVKIPPGLRKTPKTFVIWTTKEHNFVESVKRASDQGIITKSLADSIIKFYNGGKFYGYDAKQYDKIIREV